MTATVYSMPLEIAMFLNELESGFRLLNLKNDSLRRRFDSLKYDLKKVEQVSMLANTLFFVLFRLNLDWH